MKAYYVYQLVILENKKEYVVETRNEIDNVLINAVFFYRSNNYEYQVRRYKVRKSGISEKYEVIEIWNYVKRRMMN